jgi:LemA protein
VKAALISILAIAALAASAEFVRVRNRLSAEREEVTAAWIQVDQAFARRADLVPALHEALDSLGGQAAGIFQDLAADRAALGTESARPEKIEANERLSNALSRLLLLTENYPQLRSNKKLLRLEEELAGTENRIAVARRKYNETLEHYNSSIQMFPENIVAALAGFSRDDNYFHTGAGARSGNGQ